MRTIYNICEICHHLALYKKAFAKAFFSSLACLIHGIILSESTVGLKKIAARCIRGKSQQSLSYFINSTSSSVFSRLFRIRLDIHAKLAAKQKKLQNPFLLWMTSS